MGGLAGGRRPGADPRLLPQPRLARGGGRDLGGATSRPGWFCFDTATPLVAGSYAPPWPPPTSP